MQYTRLELIPPDPSQTISTTTNLLLTTVTAASSYYISHSAPSPHHSSSPAPAGGPPPVPPRALVFLTSEKTRQNLANVHAVSSKAVHVSSKTVSAIDNMIRRAVGGKPKPSRRPSPAPGGYLSPSPGPARAPSPSYFGPSPVPPPAYSSSPNGYGNDKSPMPPRGPSPLNGPPPIPPRTGLGPPPGVAQQQDAPRLKLSTKARILFSADLILSTIDASTRRALDVGTDTVGNVVHHK